ncbi:MAG: Hsp20/alpha crystallin family protein [Pseudobutyrivibrio sp.]|nr:Hsp20/alpha crystallin family protein [Pseudobutyrivibrio sp.]
MLMPSIFSNDFMDDFFGVPRVTGIGQHLDHDFSRMMSTDVKETEKGYSVDMNLPGFAKEDIKAELKDGYLTIKAETNQDNDEKDADGKYIRRERYTGSCSRSFYVGDGVTQEDIHATFKDGVLALEIPKKEAIPQEEEAKYIAIEG